MAELLTKQDLFACKHFFMEEKDKYTVNAGISYDIYQKLLTIGDTVSDRYDEYATICIIGKHSVTPNGTYDVQTLKLYHTTVMPYLAQFNIPKDNHEHIMCFTACIPIYDSTKTMYNGFTYFLNDDIWLYTGSGSIRITDDLLVVIESILKQINLHNCHSVSLHKLKHYNPVKRISCDKIRVNALPSYSPVPGYNILLPTLVNVKDLKGNIISSHYFGDNYLQQQIEIDTTGHLALIIEYGYAEVSYTLGIAPNVTSFTVIENGMFNTADLMSSYETVVYNLCKLEECYIKIIQKLYCSDDCFESCISEMERKEMYNNMIKFLTLYMHMTMLIESERGLERGFFRIYNINGQIVETIERHNYLLEIEQIMKVLNVMSNNCNCK
jgi:hypothetical protein